MENPNEDQGYRKLPQICKFLQTIYPELQSHCKATKWAKRKEEMGMERRTLTGFWRTQRQDNKSTDTLTSKKRRKI